jgi:hypothetical protein
MYDQRFARALSEGGATNIFDIEVTDLQIVQGLIGPLYSVLYKNTKSNLTSFPPQERERAIV